MFDTDVMMTLMASLGEELGRARAERAQTQKQAAVALGVSQPTYNSWERNRKRPEHDKVARIADYIGRSIPEVLLAIRMPTEVEPDDAMTSRIARIEADLEQLRDEFMEQNALILQAIAEVERRNRGHRR